MSGLDALRALRSTAVASHIPAIALTAAASPHDIRRGLEVGFQRYLTKPMRLEELIAVLEEQLSRRG